ncbi:hypothetical protein, partial [uncultured Campylobacter sp.]|uniref:hypothetical protein n=1 Tax=uncultured Campylobacter sp. TaxID=218934 RepID=UPI00261BD96D
RERSSPSQGRAVLVREVKPIKVQALACRNFRWVEGAKLPVARTSCARPRSKTDKSAGVSLP